MDGELAPAAKTIGPIRLSPGVPRREVIVFLFVTGIAVVLTAFVNLMQPYVFREMMHIPVSQQGRLAGQLMTVQQAVVLVCVSFAGALADRIGRKALIVVALVGYSLAAILLPIAGTIVTLFLIRVMFGAVSSCHTAGGPPKFFDYPDNASRGKFMALVMVFYAVLNVLLIGTIGSHLPVWLAASGTSLARAGTIALWAAGAIGLASAVLTMVALMPDRPAPAARQIARPGMFAGFGEVVATARANRKFGVLMLTAFVIRTDTAVLGSFLALWITISGAKEGLTSAQAVGIAGVCTSLISAMSFVVPPLLGVVLDRANRMVVYLVAIAGVGAVFLCAPLTPSVKGLAIYVLAVFIGIAESAQTISQQAFFGEEAPAHLRGTAYGLLAFFGTLSVVVVSFAAGYLFDALGPTAPFTMIGSLHVIFTLLALLYLRLSPARAEAALS